ncbi:MAG TPA: helix-turn-helix transcriptional regulator [Anaerolineae bacterium]|nr:helix-turn-helix transcriptional regulator [Anaerolineae bacterium]HPL29682.1 helix-turn-helix transcriptional regulator [Anaerolineae bacterium]HPL29683.1 helix-turn-helix transcriptional regulator [Anaerolineae bacterium]
MATRRDREEGAMHDEPCYVISIAAKLVALHPQTLRYYERLGLVVPSRSRGKVRLYSPSDIERLQRISRLVEDLGVNLAGVEVILNLTERIEQMQAEMDAMRAEMEAEIEHLRALLDERSRNLPTVRRRQLPSGRPASQPKEDES